MFEKLTVFADRSAVSLRMMVLIVLERLTSSRVILENPDLGGMVMLRHMAIRMNIPRTAVKNLQSSSWGKKARYFTILTQKRKDHLGASYHLLTKGNAYMTAKNILIAIVGFAGCAAISLGAATAIRVAKKRQAIRALETRGITVLVITPESSDYGVDGTVQNDAFIDVLLNMQCEQCVLTNSSAALVLKEGQAHSAHGEYDKNGEVIHLDEEIASMLLELGRIRMIRFTNVSCDTDGRFFWNKCKGLHSMEFINCNDLGAIDFNEIDTIESLRFDHCVLTNDALLKIAKSSCSALTLRNCSMPNSCLPVLGGMHNLGYLDVAKSEIDPESLQDLRKSLVNCTIVSE